MSEEETGEEYGLEEFSEGETAGGDGSEWGSEDAGDGVPEWSGGDPSAPSDGTTTAADTDDGALLDPESAVDNTLTAVAGILAGLVIGIVATFSLLFVTGSAIGFVLGVIAWLGSTAYLVRRRSVFGAISHGAYGIATVLLLLPLVMFSPAAEGDVVSRIGGFIGLLVGVAIPAGIAAAVGYGVSRFDPTDGSPVG